MGKKSGFSPIIKLWDGTSVHQSLDTSLMNDVASKLCDLGLESIYRGTWSYEKLVNGKQAFVTHTRRLGGMNPYSVSQRDAEKWMINITKGLAPKNACMKVAAHGHTIRGTIDDEPFKIINSPCWATFQEYDKALGNFEHYQTDIGAFFIFVTNEGRIRLQSWLYQPFTYNHHLNEIYEGENSNKKFVELTDKPVIESYLKTLASNSKQIIAVTADYHCGHTSAIAPPQYNYNGVTWEIKQSKANARIYSYWQHFIKTCKLLGVTDFWVIGDACDGRNVFADKTHRTLTQNLDEQKALFIELFKDFL